MLVVHNDPQTDKTCAAKVCKSFESESGVTLPLKYFDPLGLSKDGDKDSFRRRRIAEIKNGGLVPLCCET